VEVAPHSKIRTYAISIKVDEILTLAASLSFLLLIYGTENVQKSVLIAPEAMELLLSLLLYYV